HDGGYPATLEDVAAAVDLLAGLHVGPVVAAGHSAGGQLAAWPAARPRLPHGAPGARPRVRGDAVVAHAGLLDLRRAAPDGGSAAAPSSASSAAPPSRCPSGTRSPTRRHPCRWACRCCACTPTPTATCRGARPTTSSRGHVRRVTPSRSSRPEATTTPSSTPTGQPGGRR